VMADSKHQVDYAAHQRSEHVLKSGQLVMTYLTKYKTTNKPIQVDPDEIGPDPCNRGGATPQIMVVHQRIAPDLKKSGFDPDRPKVGVLRHYKSEDGLARFRQWNEGFSHGNPAFPAIKSCMNKGSVASTHLTLTLRCFKEGMTSCITGEVFVVENDVNLEHATQVGHLYWILAENTPDDVMMEISEYYNSDNNTNIRKHEIELIRTIQSVAKPMLLQSRVLVVASVIAKTMGVLRVTVSARQLMILAKLCISLGCSAFVDEICEWHSLNVNPNELTIPLGMYENFDKLFAGSMPIIKCVLFKLAFNKDVVQEKVRPNPDMSDFLKEAELKALSARTEELAMVEINLSTTRVQLRGCLATQFGSKKTSDVMHEFESAIMLTMMGKRASEIKWLSAEKNSKMSEEKVASILKQWKLYVQTRHFVGGESPAAWPMETVAIPDIDIDVDSAIVVRTSTRMFTLDDDNEELQQLVMKGFVVGKMVKLIKRITTEIKTPIGTKGNTETQRKDLATGTIGELIGYCEGEGSLKRAIVQFKVVHENIQYMSDMSVQFNNMEIYSHDSKNAGRKNDPPSVAKACKKGMYKFLYGEGDDETTVEIIDLEACSFSEKFNNEEGCLFLKSIIHVGQHLLCRGSQKLTKKDIVCCKRGGQTEVWTVREFKRLELCLYPFTTELKDRYWTQHRSNIVGVDKECQTFGNVNKKTIVMDGRLRGTPSDSRGMSLFFAIGRIENKEKSNMEIHDVSLNGTLSLQGDTKSDKRTHNFGNITYPVYKNPKVIKAGIMLLGYEDPKVQLLLKHVSNEEESTRKRTIDEKKQADDKPKGKATSKGSGKKPRLKQ
jgi:hypothetical protein